MRNVDRLMRLVASVELEPDRYKRMEMIAEVRRLERRMREDESA